MATSAKKATASKPSTPQKAASAAPAAAHVAVPAAAAESSGSQEPSQEPGSTDQVAETRTFTDTVAPERFPADTPTAVHRLERAQELPEVAADAKAKPVADGIRSFKDIDRRTMNVVLVAAGLAKQEVRHGVA